MSSPRAIKEEKVKEFQEVVAAAKTIVLAEYKGLTVDKLEDLRTKLREAGGRLQVIKNTLARVALHNAGIEDLDAELTGQVAFVFSNEDAVGGTKVAQAFSRANEAFKIRAGYFNNRKLDIAAVRELANLPGRSELQARLVGTLSAPLTQFVGTITAPLREFVGTLDAYSLKRAEQGGEGE